MIISGRFVVPKPVQLILGSFYGPRGEIALVKNHAVIISPRVRIENPIVVQPASIIRV